MPDAEWVTGVVAGQIGRPPRGLVGVAVTCPYGFPAVIETSPYLEDGTPFPTLLYLVCPSAVDVVGGVESRGGVAAFRERVRAEPRLSRALEELATSYRARRSELANARTEANAGPGGSLSDCGAVMGAGIGGPDDPERATCLHAYVAALLAATEGWFGHPRASPVMDDAPPVYGDIAGDGDAAPMSGGDLQSQWADLLAGFGDLWCGDRRCAAFAPAGRRRAAIDLGTNSVRLLVAQMEHGRPQTLLREARVTRLGEGLRESGDLLPEARRRTATAVADYVAEARRAGSEAISLVGTSACREAADGRAFVAALGREHGLLARVVSGETEALLSFTGATLDLDGDIVLLDLGGGSTELVRRLSDGTVAGTSLDVGCVRATARWFTDDPPPPEERAAVRAEAALLGRAVADRFGADALGGARLVGVAGTVTTLACLVLGLEDYDSDAIHLRELTCGQLEEQVERLALMSPAERRHSGCMQAGREGVIVAGGDILLALMEALGWERLTVSERDILDGILVLGEGLKSS